MTNIPPAQDPVQAVQSAFSSALKDAHTFRDETTLVVERSSLTEVMHFLRDSAGLAYNFLSDISAVDYYPDYDRPERFGVSYHLYSMLYNRRLRVKVFVPEDTPLVPSVAGLWLAADWLEREIFDMMGITFEDHPDLRRLLMPEDWHGHPHRRDYPLGYETPMFSFNVEEIMKNKPFAND